MHDNDPDQFTHTLRKRTLIFAQTSTVSTVRPLLAVIIQ
jgi:hypothetical protein